MPDQEWSIEYQKSGFEETECNKDGESKILPLNPYNISSPFYSRPQFKHDAMQIIDAIQIVFHVHDDVWRFSSQKEISATSDRPDWNSRRDRPPGSAWLLDLVDRTRPDHWGVDVFNLGKS